MVFLLVFEHICNIIFLIIKKDTMQNTLAQANVKPV